ncbi:MAG: NifB/NifX family molybdenum-iron cluster-binding protein [Gammaproteobacteria bacterium]|jgi:predicted Fe-Mo cluster-binding NifX family protein
MKIAIAVATADADAQIEVRGARAAYYLIVDTGTGRSETAANPAAQTERAAGPTAAAFLIGRGVNKVIAGDFGPRFRAELEEAGIACELKTGMAAAVIKQQDA